MIKGHGWMIYGEEDKERQGCIVDLLRMVFPTRGVAREYADLWSHNKERFRVRKVGLI